MEWKRAKNIILCVLVFANLFLAINLGALIDRRLGEQQDKTAIAIKNLRRRGHTVYEDAEKKLAYQLYIYDVPRNESFEAEIAEGLLGKCTKESKGGGIEEYSSDIGLCTFRSGGNFLCEIYGRNIENDMEKSARDIIKAMGIKKYKFAETGKTSVSFTTKAADKFAVEDYNVKIEQTTRGVQISGRLLDMENAVRSSVSPDYAKILIKIADSAEKEGINLEILSMEVVYIADYAQADETVLTPYMKLLEADGIRYVNLNTSEIIKN
ncbi:MAG: hypothetical protein E7432_00400 [Ruminococcaceae bacterium]|nr:hypothetical protein [Oscillospiraceae bacterium]